MGSREYIDFNFVKPEDKGIDARLQNWGRSMGGGRGGAQASPMFQLYRPDNYEREYGAATKSAVDHPDARRLDETIKTQPIPHRTALVWCYCSGRSLGHIRKVLNESPEGVMAFIHAGRQKLVDMGH